MKKVMLLLSTAFLFLAATSFAADAPGAKEVEGALYTFAEGCQEELTSFCKDVTPGEGRILACLYAFGDKVSPRCEYALYDSIGQLNRTLTNLSYVVNECGGDLNSHCAEIKPGEGRLLNCLKKNESTVSKRCQNALQDVGYEK